MISTKAKERFCKDCNIPIRIFQEPYFTERLILLDKFYGTIEKWELFLRELSKYNNEQDYFEEYNCVKDAAIDSIKSSEAFQEFNYLDDNLYRAKPRKLPNKDIFKETNDGKTFISIDMKKANFSALHNYSPEIFGGAKTWEAFIGRFTDNKHIINSKYIRQVILGNCNPKRQITYEKYLMDKILDYLLGKNEIALEDIVFFSNDEIIVDVSNKKNQLFLRDNIDVVLQDLTTSLRVELFTLHKIHGTDGYYKEFNGGRIEFKCLDNYMLPFVIRHFLREEVTENDRVFYHEGLLAQFVEIPNIEVN